MNTVVVTGLGMVTPFGLGIDILWDRLLKGHHAFRPITGLAPKPLVGAPVDLSLDTLLDPRVLRQTDRFVHFGLIAAEAALSAAGNPHRTVSSDRMGVVLGNAVGGLGTFRDGTRTLADGGRLSPFFVPAFIPNMAAARIAMAFQIHGMNLTVSTACAAGTDAIGIAFDIIRNGRADVVIAGGAEALFIPEMVTGLLQTRALSPVAEPDEACRPFDQDRTGMVMGEGAAILILEREDHARARGIRALARVLGYGSAGDGEHPAAPAVDGHGQRLAMATAIKEAGIRPQDVDYVNAHGTATVVGDRVEWTSILEVVGPVTTSSIKGSVGHLLGAAGALEAAVTVKILEEQMVPPTVGCQRVDPLCPLDIVHESPRRLPVKFALSNSFGLGGQNASVVLGRI